MKALEREKQWIKFLEQDHKIRREVWEKHGIDFNYGYLHIPIKNVKTGTIDFKTRKQPTYNGASKYVNPRGLSITLYPNNPNLDIDWLVLCEGELDCLTCESYEIPAVTTTGGVGGFKEEFVEKFSKVKKIYIVFDNDKAGGEGSERVSKLLQRLPYTEIYIVSLSHFTGVKDIGDFFKLGYSKDEFLDLLKKTEKVVQTETPLSTNSIELIDRPLTYDEISQKVEAYLPESGTGLKLLLAVAVSGYFKNPLMLWLLLVGVPSSGKTDLVRLIKNSPITYYLDNLTQNAFISGEREVGKNKVYDLLSYLDKKCLVIKDWTSIFSLDEKMTKKILGDLVGIYDKEFSKFSSARGNISYSAEFSQIGCITPATLTKHHNYMNTVGPRFLCYTLPEISETKRDKSFKDIFSGTSRFELEKKARQYVCSYVEQLIHKEIDIKLFNIEVQNYLKLCAELTAKCRGIAHMEANTFKNEDGKVITFYDPQEIQIEEPWRAVQQLMLLAKFLAFVQGKDSVGSDDLEIIKNVVLSTMPASRATALKKIIENGGTITSRELSESVQKSTRNSLRLLDELSYLGVLQKIKNTDSQSNEYLLDNKFKKFLLYSTAEFLSNINVNESDEDSGVLVYTVRDGKKVPLAWKKKI